MDWYKNKQNLKRAIDFVLQYNCLFPWSVYASSRRKTPCCSYDAIPLDLEQAVVSYLDSLPKKEYSELNSTVAYLLGEFYYCKKKALVTILCRLLSCGDPTEEKALAKFSLTVQIRKRVKLYQSLC